MGKMHKESNQQENADRYYILVEGATQALAIFTYLRQGDCPCRIAPTPHGAQACCGTSIMIEPSHREQAEQLLHAHDAPAHESMIKIENAVSPHRDRFC